MAERPEDLNLPNAVITRIIKDAIPDGVNVSKEARLAISKAATYKKNQQGKKDQKRKDKVSQPSARSGGGDGMEDEGVVVLEESEGEGELGDDPQGDEPMDEAAGVNGDGDVVEISDTSEDA
ncbi:DPOE3-like protein [Mya arenaria]|uniref:DPOE3-like protein n=1 Tax=Mya arenaria TaxID=6604 RepID=A0ABY7GES6_MYAAR|nr:DPOE3-like protein [Mya arenaria]WAR31441.1 DPOE3-like protein [Mya arenaria]